MGRTGGRGAGCMRGRPCADLLDQVLDGALAAPHAPDVVEPVDVALDAQQDGGAVEGGPAEDGVRAGRRAGSGGRGGAYLACSQSTRPL